MMKRSRTVILTHPNRLDMERAYIQGEAVAKIARDFGVSEDSLRNHCANNISRQLSQAWAAKELTTSFDLLSEIDGIIAKTKDIFQRNYDRKKDVIALKALDSHLSTLELLCKISAYLHESKLLEQQSDHSEWEHKQKEENQKLIHEMLDKLTKVERDIYSSINMKMIGAMQGDMKIIFHDTRDVNVLLEDLKRFIHPDFSDIVYPDEVDKARFKRGKKKEDIEDTPEGDHPVQPVKTSEKQQEDPKYPDWYNPNKKYLWINGQPQRPLNQSDTDTGVAHRVVRDRVRV